VIALLVCALSPFTLVQTTEARFAGSEPVNGNQELISHPTLPFAYYGGSSEVIVYNYNTGTTTAHSLGDDGTFVSSMDINAAGTSLVAACGSSIYILTLVDGVPTSITPMSSDDGIVRSVCYGPGDVIYVTYESNYVIEAYSGGVVIDGSQVDTGLTEACVLETNEDRSVLIAASMGGSDTTIITYDIPTDPAVAPTEKLRSSPITGKLAQLEAAGTSIYLACTGADGIQVVSLETLAVTATYGPMLDNPSGIALSRDNTVVFGVSANGPSYPTGQAAIYAFDTSGARLSTKYVDYVAGPIAPGSEKWNVVTAFPLKLETVGPEITANAPLPDSVYAYSPGFVRFNIIHDPVIDAGSVTATVDGTPYPVVRMTSQIYQVNLTSALPAGAHSVSISVPWGGTTISASWSFTSGSTSGSALQPSLSMIDPVPGSTTDASPGQIVLGVDMPAPPPFSTEITVKVNDLTLSAVADPDDLTRYTAILPSGLDLAGENNVTAIAVVDGFEVNGTWKFTVEEDTGPEESYSMIDHGDNFSIPAPVNWTVLRDFGGWELAFTGPSYQSIATNVFVDIVHDPSVRANREYIEAYAQTVLSDTIAAGDQAEMVGEVNHTAISNLTAGVWKIRLTDKGVQEAYALIVDEVNGDRWLIMCSASDTSFIDLWPIFEHMISGVEIEAAGAPPVVVPPSTQGYVYYRMLGDYQLMIPDNWTIKREAAAGDLTASLKLIGPKVGDLHVTILLQNGTDATVQDDRDYLLGLVQSKFLPELEARGIEASIYEEARILSISNHATLVFSIRWTDLQNELSVVQEIYFIVDEENHRYWRLTCEAPEEAYVSYVQVFDKVAQSFAPLSSSNAPTTSGGLLSDPTTMLMIAVLVVTGAAAVIVFLVAKRYRPRI